MTPIVFPKFKYEIFYINKISEDMHPLLGKFIYASTQIIKRGKQTYRLLSSGDRKKLFDNLEIDNDAGCVVRIGNLVLFPKDFLVKPKIPDCIPDNF